MRLSGGIPLTTRRQVATIERASMGDWTSFPFGKFLVVAGVLLVAVGLLVMAGSKSSLLGLGRLPGDISYKGKHVQVNFPLVTCLLLSGVLTLVWWVVSHRPRR